MWSHREDLAETAVKKNSIRQQNTCSFGDGKRGKAIIQVQYGKRRAEPPYDAKKKKKGVKKKKQLGDDSACLLVKLCSVLRHLLWAKLSGLDLSLHTDRGGCAHSGVDGVQYTLNKEGSGGPVVQA